MEPALKPARGRGRARRGEGRGRGRGREGPAARGARGRGAGARDEAGRAREGAGSEVGLKTSEHPAQRDRGRTQEEGEGREGRGSGEGGEGRLLSLAIAARGYFPAWARSLEAASGVDIGLCASGGFFAPAFEGDAVHRWRPPASGGASAWLDRTAAAAMEPLLSPEAHAACSAVCSARGSTDRS